jgi:uncharacterized protein
MSEVTVQVETEIYPTEDEEAVKAAVNNIISGANITIKPAQKGSTLYAEAKGQQSLMQFRKLLHQDRIRDAARKLLFRAIRGETICFYLNKQVALAGHISFSEETAESPLGPIKITITTENPRELVERLAQKT